MEEITENSKNRTSFVIIGLCLTVLDLVTSRPTSSDLNVNNLLNSSPVTAIVLWARLIMMAQNVHCTALGTFFVAFLLSQMEGNITAT